MSGVRWLDAPSWRDALDRLGPSDVYFSPDYHLLHERNGDGRAVCAAIDLAGGSQLLVPGLRVPLSGGAADLQSCNGYGGPLAPASSDRSALELAWSSWREAARGDGIVAAMFRLHPILDNRVWLPDAAIVRRERSTALVDLKDGAEAAWRTADSRHRNMVNKGRRANVAVTWNTDDGWDAFVALYRAAMTRLNAPSSLRFSDDYFAAIRMLPGCEVAILEDEHGPAAGALFLFGSRFAHYHLAARRSDAPNHAANLVLQSAIERASERGLEGLHLGGGTTNDPEDPLLRFKRSIGGTLLDFHVALVVADEVAYAALLAQWTARTGAVPTWLLGYRQPF